MKNVIRDISRYKVTFIVCSDHTQVFCNQNNYILKQVHNQIAIVQFRKSLITMQDFIIFRVLPVKQLATYWPRHVLTTFQEKPLMTHAEWNRFRGIFLQHLLPHKLLQGYGPIHCSKKKHVHRIIKTINRMMNYL